MNYMNGENISSALNMLDDDIIEEVDRLRSGSAVFKPKRRYVRWAALAACLCMIAAGVFVWFSSADRQGRIPADEDYLDEDIHASLIPCFIYQGNLYEGHGSIFTNPDLAGEKLGTAKMSHSSLITDWGNEDFTGTVNGDVYTVKGYDPSFMLCIKESLSVWIFVRKTGWEFKKGSELLEDKLHLSENFLRLLYESQYSWAQGLKEKHYLINDELVEKFIAEIDSAEFIPCDSIPLGAKEQSIFNKRLYHLYFDLKGGIEARFYLLAGGYVIYEGVSDVCVKLSDETYMEMLEALEGSR